MSPQSSRSPIIIASLRSAPESPISLALDTIRNEAMRRDIHDSSVEIPAGKSLWVALSVSGYRLQPVPEGYNHPMPRPNDTGTLLACFSLTTNMCGIWPKVGDLMTADEGLQKMRTFIAEKGRGNRA